MINKKWSIIVLGLVLVMHLMFTFFSSDMYSGKVEQKLKFENGAIWNHLMNVKELHLTRKELDTVIVEKKLPGGMQQWREVYKNGDEESFKHTSKKQLEYIEFETIESDKGIVGKWKFEIVPLKDLTDGNKCVLIVKEESTATNFFYKWIHSLVGRDARMKRMTETLKHQLEEAANK